MGIAAVRDRAARMGEPFAVRRRLARVLARALGNEGLPHLKNLLERKPTPGVKRDIDRLVRELETVDDDWDGDGGGTRDGGKS